MPDPRIAVVTDSTATRDMPDARSYLHSFNGNEYVYTSSYPAQMRWEALEDNVTEGRLNLSYPIHFGESPASRGAVAPAETPP